MTKKTLSVVTYLRVSTEEQDVASQRLELADWTSRAGASVVGEFSDVMSGAKAVRPGMDALLARCAAGGVDAVVVVKLDRMGRSLLNVLNLVDRLALLGVGLICTSQGIDTRSSNPCGKMMLSVLAAVAEFERDIIRERTVSGLKVARAKGVVLGRPSPTLIGLDARAGVVAKWIGEHRPAGLRGLAKALGGCSPMTAGRVLQAYLDSAAGDAGGGLIARAPSHPTV